MKFTFSKALTWIALFILLSLVPIALALLGPIPKPRSYWIEFGVGLGFVGIAVMALQFLTTGRLRFIAPVFGPDFVLQFHRQAGIVGFLLVLSHPLVLIFANPDYLAYFDPRVNFLRAVALSAVLIALILLIVTSLWREPVGLNYEWWRLLHGVLALAVVFIGMVHGIQVGHYLEPLWKQGVWAGLLLGTMYLAVHTRVVRPWRLRKRPYRVADIHEEEGDAWTLVLEPDGHSGMTFKAGQYAWITLADSPFRLQQHPFSFSSSARQQQICFTAKALGDFTTTWEHIEPGAPAYLEGPYGAFTLDRDAYGAVLIMGGIGITPAMSILRTMCDEGDLRPVILIYANPAWEEITFREKLDELAEQINLLIVHVLEEPPEDWTGETGYVDEELLAAHLPENREAYEYFICGPTPMMNSSEVALRELGISWKQIYSERFQIV